MLEINVQIMYNQVEILRKRGKLKNGRKRDLLRCSKNAKIKHRWCIILVALPIMRVGLKIHT